MKSAACLAGPRFRRGPAGEPQPAVHGAQRHISSSPILEAGDGRVEKEPGARRLKPAHLGAKPTALG